MLEDYKISTTYNVPIGTDLDSISVFRTDCFAIIDDEIARINKHKADQNG